MNYELQPAAGHVKFATVLVAVLHLVTVKLLVAVVKGQSGGA